jgi:hypothetical protein
MKGTLMTNDVANDNLPAAEKRGSPAMTVELRVWWIPQLPMEPFYYPVPHVAAAKLLVNALARYDLFQLKNKIKPDYCNAGVADWLHPELTGGEWFDFDLEDESDCDEVEAAIAKANVA